MPTEEQGETPEIVEQEIEQPKTETVGEQFDAERAMATIKAQRESERRALAEAEKLQKELEKYREAERKRKEAEMTETEKLQQALAERDARLKELEIAQLQRQAADKHGLPPAFATRLKGETLEELEADAEAMAGLLPKVKPVQPAVNPGSNASGKGETEAQQRARIYGRDSAGLFDPAEIEKQGGGVFWVNKDNKS